MMLIRVRHYYGAEGDAWDAVSGGEDWTEAQCREYVQAQDSEAYELGRNEYARPDYYTLDEAMPDWSEGAWYDYDCCDSRGETDAACGEGCDACPHMESCVRLQRAQQIAWIKAHGVEAHEAAMEQKVKRYNEAHEAAMKALQEAIDILKEAQNEVSNSL